MLCLLFQYHFQHFDILSFILETCDAKADICFIVDASNSITYYNPRDESYDNWVTQLEFLTRIVDRFTVSPNDVRIGAVVFSDHAELAFKLNNFTDAEAVKNAIFNMKYLNQSTNTAEAFRLAREQCFNVTNGDRHNIPNLAILISDGRPEPDENIRVPAALAEAEALKNTDVILLAIGVTNHIDEDFLRSVSSAPQIEGQNYFLTADFNYLGTIQKSVVEEACEPITGKDTVFIISVAFKVFGCVVGESITRKSMYSLYLPKMLFDFSAPLQRGSFVY